METLVKPWFAVHTIKFSKHQLFWNPLQLIRLKQDKPIYRHQHTHTLCWSFWTFTTSECKVQDISVAEKKKKKDFSLHKIHTGDVYLWMQIKLKWSWAADHPLQSHLPCKKRCCYYICNAWWHNAALSLGLSKLKQNLSKRKSKGILRRVSVKTFRHGVHLLDIWMVR